jgi:hypothetical protein
MANQYPNFENVPQGGSDIWNNDDVFTILREDFFELPFVPVYMPMNYVSGYFYADATP